METGLPRVAVLDDDPATLDAVRRTLRAQPCELLTTERPDEFLDWVSKGDVSVAISDRRMPMADGVAVLQVVGRNSPGTVRLLLTAYHDDLPPGFRERTGIRDVIPKPWPEEGLRRTVSVLLLEQRTARRRAAEIAGGADRELFRELHRLFRGDEDFAEPEAAEDDVYPRDLGGG